MARIVHTETYKDRSMLDNGFVASQVDLDRKATVWQDERKVGISFSRLRSGSVRGTDKRWYRWGTHLAFGFRYSSRGNVVPYEVTRATSLRATDLWVNRRPLAAFGALEGTGFTEGVIEAFQKAVAETFRVRTLHDIYPLARHYDISRYVGIPSNVRPAFRYDDVRDAAVVLFGKQRALGNKFLPDAMSRTDPYMIAVAEQFRGLTEDKNLVKFMAENDFDDEMEQTFTPHTPRLRPIVRRLSPDSRGMLLSSGIDNMDLKRIHAACGEGINLQWSVKRVDEGATVKNWKELTDITTGRIF